MTPQQLIDLKAHIDGDPALSAFPNTSDGAFGIAALMNLPASPAFVVWRTRVTKDEVQLNGFTWSRVDNLSVGKARVWDWMFDNQSRSLNPSKANIRAGIDATWVGTQADLDVRAAVYAHCKMNATRAQKLFSTGTGSDAVPATMGTDIGETFQLSYADVEAARNLP